MKTTLRQEAFNPVRRGRERRKDDAADDMKAGMTRSTGATESIAIGTGIAAIVAVKTTGGEDIGTRKALFIHVTKTEGIGTGAEVVIQNVTGDKDGTMPCAARVVARVTDGGAGPETETATDTAAGPQSTG